MSGRSAAPARGRAGPGEVAATRLLGAKRRASRSALMGYQVMLRGDSPSAASPGADGVRSSSESDDVELDQLVVHGAPGSRQARETTDPTEQKPAAGCRSAAELPADAPSGLVNGWILGHSHFLSDLGLHSACLVERLAFRREATTTSSRATRRGVDSRRVRRCTSAVAQCRSSYPLSLSVNTRP